MYDGFQRLESDGLSGKRSTTPHEDYLSSIFQNVKTQVIAVVNQKGGCGKTTTSINLAACLAERGYRVLLVDTDPQAQASLGLGVDTDGIEYSLYNTLVKNVPLKDIVQPSGVNGLSVIPANSALSGAQLELASSMGRETILKAALRKFLLTHPFDYIIIDCSPTLNLVTMNSLVAADYVLVPFQTHYFSLQGIKELFHTIDIVKERLNADLKTLGIVVTLFDKRMKMNHQILGQMRDYFKDLVFKSVVHYNVKLTEAPLYKQPVHVYAPKSRGAEDYWGVSQEVIDRTQQQTSQLTGSMSEYTFENV